jgi:RNA exonuclease 4
MMVTSEMGPKKRKIDAPIEEAASKKVNITDEKVVVDGKKKKKYRGKKKKSSDKETVVKLPNKQEDFSSNWKKLLSKMENDPNAVKRKKKPPPRPLKEPLKEPLKATENKVKKKPEIWFDDVDEFLLDPEDRPSTSSSSGGHVSQTLVKERSFQGLTKILAMDCEMVGIGFGGNDSILARVSIVNHFGHCVYDKFVKPTEKVTDYRTYVSGIRPEDIKDGEDFKLVQKEVSEMLNGRVLIGHSIKHDLKVLFLDHPRKHIRDTSTYKPFRAAFGGRTPSLKNLTATMIGVKVQEGEHSSVQDAQATMRLYTMVRKQWEEELTKKRVRNAEQNTAGKKISEKPKVATATANKISSSRLLYQDSDSE